MALFRHLVFVGVLVALTYCVGGVDSTSSQSGGRWAEQPAAVLPSSPLRSHFRENGNLAPLSEDELETLLFLLDKVRPESQGQVQGGQSQWQGEGQWQGGQGPLSRGYGGGVQTGYGSMHERRNKRTGHLQPHKKSVDWSNYFGIDKRSVPAAAAPQTSAVEAAPAQVLAAAANPLSTIVEDLKEEVKDKVKGKNKEAKLSQFYKSMAMATNMGKKKRSTGSSQGAGNDLEKQMKSAGDHLIWDALKMTGAHKDQPMSKAELAQLKDRLVREIGAAYSLEKLRQLLKSTVGA